MLCWLLAELMVAGFACDDDAFGNPRRRALVEQRLKRFHDTETYYCRSAMYFLLLQLLTVVRFGLALPAKGKHSDRYSHLLHAEQPIFV